MRVAFPEEDVDSVLERLARRDLAADRRDAGAARARCGGSSRSTSPGAGASSSSTLDWTLSGRFGRRVLRVTSEIPYGGVHSYGEVAAEAGSPRGSRAAGNALGSNPIPIVIPCHRVLRTGGALGGYGGGLERKRWLLELEGAIAVGALEHVRKPAGAAASGGRLSRRRRGGLLGLAAGAHWASAGSPCGHARGRRHAGRVAQVPLGVERRLAARAGGGDRLAVGVVDEVAGGEHARAVGARGACPR